MNLRERLPAKPLEPPAYVYVPSYPRASDERQVRFQARELVDGTPGLPVFTTSEALVAQLGEFQPFEKVAVLDLLVQFSRSNVQVVVDPVLGEGVQRWTAADLAELSGSVEP